MGRLIAATVIALTPAAILLADDGKRFEFVRTEMAVPIRVVLYTTDADAASEAARAAFDRIGELNSVFSDYDPHSELRRLCDRSAEGRTVPVSGDLWRVLLHSQQLAERSDGAFDVTVGPVVRLWRNARHTKELPSARSLDAARAKVGRRLMKLHADSRAVELFRPDMRLDLGGIAKGYAVDEAMKVLRRHGVARMLIDAGGNLGLGDPPPGETGWRIGVVRSSAAGSARQYLLLANCSVSTSGDLCQYAVIGGVRYSHLVDPRDGRALTGRRSATVVGPNGMTTDGLSSAVAVLGPVEGLRLIDDTPGFEASFARIVDGREEVFLSHDWKQLPEAKTPDRDDSP